MSLDKSIEHGREKRKPYRHSKAIDSSCRNHGDCPHCKNNRQHKRRKQEPVVDYEHGHLTDPGNSVEDWIGGWLNGEWKCPFCKTIIGENLRGESPYVLVSKHQAGCESDPTTEETGAEQHEGGD